MTDLMVHVHYQFLRLINVIGGPLVTMNNNELPWILISLSQEGLSILEKKGWMNSPAVQLLEYCTSSRTHSVQFGIMRVAEICHHTQLTSYNGSIRLNACLNIVLPHYNVGCQIMHHLAALILSQWPTTTWTKSAKIWLYILKLTACVYILATFLNNMCSLCSQSISNFLLNYDPWKSILPLWLELRQDKNHNGYEAGCHVSVIPQGFCIKLKKKKADGGAYSDNIM